MLLAGREGLLMSQCDAVICRMRYSLLVLRRSLLDMHLCISLDNLIMYNTQKNQQWKRTNNQSMHKHNKSTANSGPHSHHTSNTHCSPTMHTENE